MISFKQFLIESTGIDSLKNYGWKQSAKAFDDSYIEYKHDKFPGHRIIVYTADNNWSDKGSWGHDNVNTGTNYNNGYDLNSLNQHLNKFHSLKEESLLEAKKDKFKGSKFYKGSDSHHGSAAKLANQVFKKVEYHEDKDGNRIREWRQGEESTDHDVTNWLKNQRVVDLHSGLEYVKPEHIKRLIDSGHLKKEPNKPYYWVTKSAAEKYNLPKVMGKEFPKHEHIGNDHKEEEFKKEIKSSEIHGSEQASSHAIAQIKAKKLGEPVHVVYNTKSGRHEATRKSVFDSYKKKNHYKIIKTYNPK